MTAQQTKLCQQLFSTNREHLIRCNEDRRWPLCLCQLMKQLRLAATHPSLIDGARQPLSENSDPQSGTFKELMRVLTAERQEDRKIVIICSDIKTAQLVHHSLNLRGMSHTKSDPGTRPKQQEKVARQFNMTDGFAVLIIPAISLEITLALLNADSLLAFDLDWLPTMNMEEVIRWYRRPAQCQPRLLRLISQQSMEQVLFELFWEDRSLVPARFELGEGDMDNQLVIMCLMKFAFLLFHDERTGDSFQILSYANHEPLNPRSIDFGENFWETIMPRESKRPVKARPLQRFWSEERVWQLYELLCDWGWGRWDKFEAFGRSIGEVVKVAMALINRFHPDLKTYRGLKEGLDPDYSATESKKFATTLGIGSGRIAEVDGAAFLRIIDALYVFAHLKPESPADVPLDESDGADEDDRKLIFLMFVHGFTRVPETFHSDLPREELQERGLLLLNRLHPHPRPTTITLRPTKKISVADHAKIVASLMSFGYPDPEVFRHHVDLGGMSQETMEKYIDHIFQYCEVSLDERKKMQNLLADKIPKYTAMKIPQRIALYRKIRAAAVNFVEYPAEDVEFLTAIAFHGMANTQMSPVLAVTCLGSCTETKLSIRIKALFAERHHGRTTQRIPGDVSERMPLRINDMLMLGALGDIDGRDGFHNELYIYPLGYKCFCVCVSPKNRENLVWMEATVEEDEGRPLFVVKPKKGGTSRYVGRTPSEPFEELRDKITRKTHMWLPPIDGHEMFGFTSAFVHRLIMEMRGFELCPRYTRRFFRSNFAFVSDWPTIGQFEPNPERLAQTVAAQTGAPKFRFKKRAFGDTLPPLVLNLAPLFSGDERSVVVHVRAPADEIAMQMYRWEKWDGDMLDEMFPKPQPM
jgi:hypothetical protein